VAEGAILVLGAGGFIGRALVARLAAQGERVVAAVRTIGTSFGPGVTIRAGELSAATDWGQLLDGARAVVHAASRAHAPPPREPEAWIAREAATGAALGEAARRGGVERVIVFSSVKVHGEAGHFRASDPPAPADPYGVAKLRLEQAVAVSGAPFTVLRPPLVYGPAVKGNFRALMRLVRMGVPLPLARIANRRSFVFLDNLLDLVERVIADRRALGRTFLMRDDAEPSTPELIRLIARGLGREARLFPVSPGALRKVMQVAGRGDDADRLLASFTVDDEATRTTLDWQPRVSLEEGVTAACRAFRGESV
jgi:nucleoside-diphosphate-sugar epimerase